MTDLAIRERVAREVMGLIKGDRKSGEPAWLDPSIPPDRKKHALYRGMVSLQGSLPAYEIDISAAWQVVEKMAEWCVKNGKAHWLPEYGLHELSHMKAERAAGYICLAALAALEAK